MRNIFENISKLKSIPKYPVFEINKDLKLLTQQEILDFIKESNKKQLELAELQSKNADKQFLNNRKLTVLALIFAFISITPIMREYIPIIAPRNNDSDIYELKNKILLLSNTNLENQVKILKVENELLKAKKNSEKQKNVP